MIESELFAELRHLADQLRSLFSKNLEKYDNDKHIHTDDLPGWEDHFWKSNSIRKAHLKTIEPVGKNKMWLMHINVFPSIHCDMPIFGLDIVATPNKVSGVFCDYSKTYDGISTGLMQTYFRETVKDLSWNRERVLPPWATEIFSADMMAAGSVRPGEELDQLCKTALRLTDFYLESASIVPYKTTINTTAAQNKYCENQKINKMLHSSILAMGIPEDVKDQYVNNVLFEVIK